ncbi:SF3A1, partial [Symbiodinium sp. CCMP2592]
DQNGFEAWRLLSKDLMPKTRNRVLALLRTINSWPSFAAQQGLAQQLLRLESAFEEYERLEPGGLPENNKMATLLSCLTGQLRQHANVVISDDSTYSDLRELVLRWDGANTKWCQKPGHYKRDCFQYKAYMQGHQKGARQVQANSSAASDAGTSTTAPSSASALQAQQGKAQSTVRRVAAEPLLFDMSDLEDPFPYEPNVCMVTVTAPQSFAMDAQDDDDQWTLPPDDYAVLDLVPLLFKGYSLAVNAQIRRVEHEEPSQFQATGEVHEVCPSKLHVASIQVRFDAKTLESLDFGWQVSTSGHLVWRGRTSRFVDPSAMAPIGWPLICRSGTWFLLELCVPWADLKEVEAVLPGGQVAEVISFLHVQVEPVSEIGVQLPAGMTEPQGLPEPDFYHFRAETEQAPVGTVEHDRVVPEDAERFLHECTHLPFKPWCPHCISMRAMPDRSEYLKEGPRDNPIVQFDFSFSGYSVPDGICNLDDVPEDSQRALKCLVAHDSATGMIAAIRGI